MTKDMSASIRAKLLNLSRHQGRAFDEIMTAKLSITFEQVLDRIKVFLYPIYSAILEETEFFGEWSKKEKNWRKEGKLNDICKKHTK
ncbi:MAG: hypothetical protein HPY66_0746 [Firmicutes bacterium]|nr:hypothetical protein [Bacillota bacterium]MDI6705679.1 hypothetical protein [Bacillota bacterium]